MDLKGFDLTCMLFYKRNASPHVLMLFLNNQPHVPTFPFNFIKTPAPHPNFKKSSPIFKHIIFYKITPSPHVSYNFKKPVPPHTPKSTAVS